MVIQDNLIPNFSLDIKPHKLHHGYLQATQALAVQTYVLGANSAVSLGPSSMKIQATHLNIANSSRSPNIGTFAHVALPMNLGSYSKVFASTWELTPVSSSSNWMSQIDTHIHTAILLAIIVPRKKNHT
jgi:hypothetical protein